MIEKIGWVKIRACKLCLTTTLKKQQTNVKATCTLPMVLMFLGERLATFKEQRNTCKKIWFVFMILELVVLCAYKMFLYKIQLHSKYGASIHGIVVSNVNYKYFQLLSISMTKRLNKILIEEARDSSNYFEDWIR